MPLLPTVCRETSPDSNAIRWELCASSIAGISFQQAPARHHTRATWPSRNSAATAAQKRGGRTRPSKAVHRASTLPQATEGHGLGSGLAGVPVAADHAQIDRIQLREIFNTNRTSAGSFLQHSVGASRTDSM